MNPLKQKKGFHMNIVQSPLKVKCNPTSLEPDLEAAHAFLKALDSANEFLFQVIDNRPAEGRKAECHTLYGTLDEHGPALAAFNRQGYGIYVTVNETRGSRRRKEDITRVRAVFREMDQADNWVPDIWPSLTVETSPGKKHDWFFVDGLSNADFEAIQRYLVAETGSDPNARDLARVLRLPGFYHMKGEPFMTRVINGAGRRYPADEIRRTFPPELYPRMGSEVEIAGDLESTPVALALVESWIDAIPGEEVSEYEDWFKFGVALARLGDDWLAEDGSDLRLKFWERLSAKAPGYDGSDCEPKWEACLDAAAEARECGATYRTLLGAAREAGWRVEACGLAEGQMIEALETLQGYSFEEAYGFDFPDTITASDDAETKGAAARVDLSVAAWLRRDIPPVDWLLGEVFSTTSRLLIYGETGVGKTLFAMDAAAAMASGADFLGWKSTRPARVMYLDGEMPASTVKERIKLIAARYGGGIPLSVYSRDVLGAGDMPPLNTPAGAVWLMREIGEAKPDFIVFDSIMCLLEGDMKDEASWEPIKPLIRRLSAICVGQLWLHHTGHNTTQGYGTKTREWELDTVAGLTKADEDGGVSLEFTKARLRNHLNNGQYAASVIRYATDGWQRAAKGSAESNAADIRLLAAIYAAPAATQSEWADAASLPRGSTYRRIASLEKAKLVEGSKGQWWITDKGRKVAALGADARPHLSADDKQPSADWLDWPETVQ